MIEKMYRYFDPSYGDKIFLEDFPMVKETPCGYWIDYWGSKKWAHKKARNAFAFDTKEKALFNYQKRKEKQIQILEYNLNQAKRNLEASKRIDLKMKLLTFDDLEMSDIQKMSDTLKDLKL